MKHPSSLVWFRHAAGDLPPPSWLAFRFHLLRCPECAARLTRERHQLAATPAPPPLFGQPAPVLRKGARWTWPALSTAGLVALGVGVLLRGGLLFVGPDLQAKGASHFDLWLPGPPARLLGAACSAGDRVQPVVVTAHRYLIVVGVDPSGQRKVLLPLGGSQSTRAPPPGASLPQSWIFDDAPGTERFVALLSETPLDASAALRLCDEKALPPQVERIERSCQKRTGPQP